MKSGGCIERADRGVDLAEGRLVLGAGYARATVAVDHELMAVRPRLQYRYRLPDRHRNAPCLRD